MKICDRSLLQRKVMWEDSRHLQPVSEILAEVRAGGDAALRALTARFDRVTVERFPVDAAAFAAARAHVPPDVLASLRVASSRIEAFHRRQPVQSWFTSHLGGVLGQMVTPLRRVGCYVPGGTAPLPSSVLHTVTLARVAGVREIVVATPPNPMYADTGYVNPVILAAAEIAGATEVLRVGGAQAIAALAFGTESIRPVDKIVGPGNVYVTLAKKLVYGVVGIDGLAGPTETVVIADDAANPKWVAADLLAQAEHDVLAAAILLTPSEPLARAVQSQISNSLNSLPRSDIICETFTRNSGIVLTRDIAEAVELANEYAPEHLCLAVRDPWAWAPQITCAGGVFLGEHSFEVLGDYVAGPSHVMPTGGSARFASPLTVLDFVRLTSLVALDPATTQTIAPHAARLAQAEQLDAHVMAAENRVPFSQRERGPQLMLRGVRVKTMNLESLLRPHILTLQPYTPSVPFEVLSARLGRAPRDIIKLDANENPYGPSPHALAALANLEHAHIYPDPESTALRAGLAQNTGVPAANLLAGAGADELIDLILRVFLEPGDAIIDCPPTFGMYAFDTALNAGRVINIPRTHDFAVDVGSIESLFTSPPHPGSPAPKLLFVTSPNNPDGSVISDADLRRLLALPVGVVLDEAYIEFHGVEHSRMKWVLEYENLMVLRTFSKRAGLAGLRVGYGAFPSALMPHLWKFKQPYNVSVAASTAAIAALEDAEYMERIVSLIVAERERLMQSLIPIPYLRPYPTRSNFVLCRVVGRDAQELKLALERGGILVRYFNKPGLTDCIRISVGKPEHTDALIAALQRL